MNALEQRQANVRAIAARRRAATHCKYGHELKPGAYYVVRRRGGRTERVCKVCKNDRQWFWRHGLRWLR